MNIFITGTGSGVGKTLVSAIITEALEADYWKPIQVGLDNGKDRDIVQNLVSNNFTKFHAERYILKFETSPHLAAAAEGINMTVSSIYEHARHMHTSNPNMIIEGVGGLKEPLNDNEFTLDLIKKLNASVIIVSRNYQGSINHSLLTAEICRLNKLHVLGWVFNDQVLDYENDIVTWSELPWIASIRPLAEINKDVIKEQADKMYEHLKLFL